MGCDQRPKVIADTASRFLGEEQIPIKVGWTKATIPVWDFDWRADGTLTLAEVPYALRAKIDADVGAELVQEAAQRAKLALACRGLMSMSDVLYWAMRALEDDEVARIVAGRFDELIVDEVQDTGDVQQECIRRLHEAGVRSLVYVGDMQQAIYGFAHADPVELQELIDDTVSDTLQLKENWRSSQALCDVTHLFSGRSDPDRAVGEHKDAGHPPELIIYPDDDEQQAVEVFVGRLDEVGIGAAEAIVLCRWTATTERLRGAPEVKLGRGLRPLVAGAAAAQGGRCSIGKRSRTSSGW
jgi:superfamily I DNA/RNA helicase